VRRPADASDEPARRTRLPALPLSAAPAFSYRSARSGSLVIGFGMAIVVETVALHALLVRHHPAIAWTLTALSVWAIAWLTRDYLALGQGAVRLEGDDLHLKVGRRLDLHMPLANVARALAPTFRDLPTPGTYQGRDFLNPTKPAAPNVLVVLAKPMMVRLRGGIRRAIGRIGLRLDDPEGFLAALAERGVRRGGSAR
jgi:hypothetical protein